MYSITVILLAFAFVLLVAVIAEVRNHKERQKESNRILADAYLRSERLRKQQLNQNKGF